jgi:putative cell wall-binding protein
MKFKLLSKIGICICVMTLLPVGTAFATDDFVKRKSNSDVGIRFEDSGNSGGGGGVVKPEPKTSSVVLASGEKYTDILTSTVLANEKDASILLTKKNNIGLSTLEEIDRLKVKDIIIVGGEESVSKNVEVLINNYGEKTNSSYKITRLAGSDRFDTAVKVGNEVRKITKKLDDSVLVDGTNFSDIITISSYASQKRIPILLTEPKKINRTTYEALYRWGINNVTIGGGYNSVSAYIEKDLEDFKRIRLAGSDRYETATVIGEEIRKLTGNKTDIALVDGTNFPDGITINPLAVDIGVPILLTNPKKLTDITKSKIKDWKIEKVIIGGGYDSVSKEIQNQLSTLKSERISGKDRYETAVKISQRLRK